MESLSGQPSGGLGLQLQMGNDVADKADNSADEMRGGGGGEGVMLHKHPVQWQTMQTIVQMDQL